MPWKKPKGEALHQWRPLRNHLAHLRDHHIHLPGWVHHLPGWVHHLHRPDQQHLQVHRPEHWDQQHHQAHLPDQHQHPDQHHCHQAQWKARGRAQQPSLAHDPPTMVGCHANSGVSGERARGWPKLWEKPKAGPRTWEKPCRWSCSSRKCGASASKPKQLQVRPPTRRRSSCKGRSSCMNSKHRRSGCERRCRCGCFVCHMSCGAEICIDALKHAQDRPFSWSVPSRFFQ